MNQPLTRILQQPCFEDQLASGFSELFESEGYTSLGAFLRMDDNIFEPVLWIDPELPETQKIIRVRSM